MKHLKFQGIEIDGPIDSFVHKLETRGFFCNIHPQGDDDQAAMLSGEFDDYYGLCDVTVISNSMGIVSSLMIKGEPHYSVGEVLEDFNYFRSKADIYDIDITQETNDYFDEDDIDLIRDGSLSKSILYQREDNSKILVRVGAENDDDSFFAYMLLIDGQSTGDFQELVDSLENYAAELTERIQEEDSTHLCFNGLEIDGDIDDFARDLEAKGFYMDMEPAPVEDVLLAKLHGQFIGEPCKVLLTSNLMGEMKAVSVDRRERKSFEVVKKEFYQLLSLYTEKYGEPAEITESVLEEADPIRALKNEDADLMAMFRVDEYGSIILLGVHVDEDGHYPHIMMLYWDGQNNQADSSFDDDSYDVDDIDELDMNDYYDDI